MRNLAIMAYDLLQNSHQFWKMSFNLTLFYFLAMKLVYAKKIVFEVESFEINSRGFGKRQSDLRDEDYVSEHDMDMDELILKTEDINFDERENETWNDLTYESPKNNEKNEVVKEDNEQDDAYKTPIQLENENIVNTSGMSSSQFFVLPRELLRK
ncbi:hypothetical protein L1887_14135 [Cichorium endivia]|nr:hypothetical protein L1887_14135 [Cichorium endivia]